MTVQQLKYAIAVSDENSMNKAAKKLFISQPSLSNAIKELEKEIGVQIFIRNNRGIAVTEDGREFLSYARQVIEQLVLLEQKYTGGGVPRKHFSVSMQHYSFAVNAFIELVREYGIDEYELSVRETMTHKIIDDVKSMRSEIGILFMNAYNEKIIRRQLADGGLEFCELFEAVPHVFVSRSNPLAEKKSVALSELENYPNLVFEQGDKNSFYYAEEIISLPEHRQTIHVTDRATMLNLMRGLNGFTVSTGVTGTEMTDIDIASVPLETAERVKVGIIVHKGFALSNIAQAYADKLKTVLVRK